MTKIPNVREPFAWWRDVIGAEGREIQNRDGGSGRLGLLLKNANEGTVVTTPSLMMIM